MIITIIIITIAIVTIMIITIIVITIIIITISIITTTWAVIASSPALMLPVVQVGGPGHIALLTSRNQTLNKK